MQIERFGIALNVMTGEKSDRTISLQRYNNPTKPGFDCQEGISPIYNRMLG
ncbi:MAG: hypothetical protein HC785_19480 [Calothrix sp. CSU_2_0]|nr:hypothetical protein [Calothrix sp. CSU_2_0]